MAFFQDMPWHAGEEQVQKTLRVPDMDNPTVPTMSPQLASHLRIAPLIAIGTLDPDGRPWTTLWGNGDHGLAQPLAQNIIGIKTAVTGKYDPVVEELVGKEATGAIVKEEGEGRMVSGLTIDLETRKRVKLYGRMVAGALSIRGDEVTDQQEAIAETQLVLKIEQSLGNCPKYLNSKSILPAASSPGLVSDSPQLPQQALDLLAKADLFFISSSQAKCDMDTNHRGGPPGFIRMLSNNASGAEIVYPEYSGNRLYQTLGNLAVTPLAGICVPDFETGDMLYLTGTTETLIGKDAAALLPKSNLAVKVRLIAARFVKQALPFRGVEGQRSPYTPKVRYLTTEQAPAASKTSGNELQQAKLLSQTRITPTISRFKFALSNPATHKAGQYATFDFSSHLDIGYSHMRDDDPGSINDDFVRTFTVSSPPGDPPNPVRSLKDDEFEITVRKVGRVTEFLFGFEGSEKQEYGGRVQELEVGLMGFGGEFEVTQRGDATVCFVAAGAGITPLLPSLHVLDMRRLQVSWAVKAADFGLVEDVVAQHPEAAKKIKLFVSGAGENNDILSKLRDTGVVVQARRLSEEDVKNVEASRFYLCTPVPMRKQLEAWLEGKELVFEDFNF